MRSHTTRVKVVPFWGAKIPAYVTLQKKLLRFLRNAVDADVIRDYEHLKTKSEPIVYYLTRLRRPNRILFFARMKKEEEKKVKKFVVPQLMSKKPKSRNRKNYAPGERFLFFERTAFFHFKNYSETAREEHTDGRNAR